LNSGTLRRRFDGALEGLRPRNSTSSYRKQIYETYQQIVALLNQRAPIVAEVGKIKQEATFRLRPQRESSRSWITSFNSEALGPFHLIVFAGYITLSYKR
jgi:hypothetical protein